MLKRILKKQNKIVIGLMSGTSVDGIDTAAIKIKYNGLDTKIKLLAFECYKYPVKLRKLILKNSNNKTAKLEEIAKLNVIIGKYFADAVLKLCKKHNLKKIDLIGSHGQTIFHLAKKEKFLNKNFSTTMQIGDPCVIAKQTGIITVGDFRIADIAVDGSGAPLVPYFDYVMFRSKIKNRALLNIGGISNITVIPRNATEGDVFAFDTGPGNIMIDYLMQKLYHRKYDHNGKIAFKGKINYKILDFMMSHKYFDKKPPKSCGREIFGENFIKEITEKYTDKISKTDLITTFTEFTALSIFRSYEKFIKDKLNIEELIISGGGVHNKYLMNALKKYFSGIKIKTIDDFNISADSKEAVCFAFLANETISGNSTNMINATGAKKKTILGKICLP